MNQEEYIKFLEERLKHSDEQLEKAMEMLATLMSKIHDRTTPNSQRTNRTIKHRGDNESTRYANAIGWNCEDYY